jgi:putative DNA primase/helicase
MLQGGVRTIHHRAGVFYTWSGTHYPPADDAMIRAHVYKFLDSATRMHAKKKGKDAPAEFVTVPFQPNRTKVSDVVDALKAAANLDSAIAAPAWLDDTRDIPRLK